MQQTANEFTETPPLPYLAKKNGNEVVARWNYIEQRNCVCNLNFQRFPKGFAMHIMRLLQCRQCRSQTNVAHAT